MESSKKTSLPSYLLQKARYDKDTHFGALCLGSVPRQRVKMGDKAPNCIGAHLHLKQLHAKHT